MSLAKEIYELVEHLPPEKQAKVLDFVETLGKQAQPKRPLKSLEGIWADLNIHITDEDIDEVRREMWKNFPREDIF